MYNLYSTPLPHQRLLKSVPRGQEESRDKHLLFPFTDTEKAPWEVAFSTVREKGVMFYGVQEVSICARTPIVNRTRLTSLPFRHWLWAKLFGPRDKNVTSPLPYPKKSIETDKKWIKGSQIPTFPQRKCTKAKESIQEFLCVQEAWLLSAVILSSCKPMCATVPGLKWWVKFNRSWKFMRNSKPSREVSSHNLV